jgi:hypothetical protein
MSYFIIFLNVIMYKDKPMIYNWGSKLITKHIIFVNVIDNTNTHMLFYYTLELQLTRTRRLWLLFDTFKQPHLHKYISKVQ